MSLNIKRFLADIIDFYIICFVSSLVIFIITLGTMKISFFTAIMYLISFFIFVIFKDFLFNDSSLGKKIFKLKVIYLNQKENKIISNIKRSLPLILVPVEIVLILKNNKRLGDVWANTEVVNN